MKIDLHLSNRISVEASPRASDQIKAIPGSKYDAKIRTWHVPRTLGALYALRATFGDLLQGSDELNAWADARNRRRNYVLSVKAGETLVAEVAEFEHLRDYQRPAVAWMSTVGRCCLADEMRTGKTVMTVATLDTLNKQGKQPFPAVIVSPNTMKFVWRDEINKFSPDTRVQVINGTAAQRRKQWAADADVFVLNWESLALHTRISPYGSVELSEKDVLEKEIQDLAPRTVIFDEAHKMVNPKTKQTRASWYVAHHATYRYALTGTPLVNTPEDAWTIMHALAPDEWPVKSKFIDRYTISTISSYGGLDVFGLNPGTQQEFYRILDPRFLRRTLREVRPEIQDKLPHQIREVDMDPKQAKAYDQLIEHMMAQTEGGLVIADSPLVLAGRLTQAAAATLTVGEDGTVELTNPSCKLAALIEVIEETHGEPIVVFAASRKLINLTEEYLNKKGYVTKTIVGGQDPEIRAANVNLFQNGQVQVMLCTFGAGSTGITLNKADRLVMLQRSWSNVENTQAAARIDGEGLVQIIDIRTRGTIEGAVYAAGDNKETLLQEIVRDHVRIGRVR